MLIHFPDNENRAPFRNIFSPLTTNKKFEVSSTCVGSVLQTPYKMPNVRNWCYSLALLIVYLWMTCNFISSVFQAQLLFIVGNDKNSVVFGKIKRLMRTLYWIIRIHHLMIRLSRVTIITISRCFGNIKLHYTPKRGRRIGRRQIDTSRIKRTIVAMYGIKHKGK